MKAGVVVFPGSNCDHDCYHVLKHVLDIDTIFLWHKEKDLKGVDFVVLPGGFSYGDYLRCGAIAGQSPIIDSIVNFAEKGGLVLGICNGFQILTETRLLPGVLLRNRDLKFICKDINLVVTNSYTPFTKLYASGEIIKMPIAHMDGNYYIDEKGYFDLKENNQIVFKYCSSYGEIVEDANPNGSVENIAGIINKKGNVLGMMPHPERCAEEILNNTYGYHIFNSVKKYLKGDI